MLHVNSQRLVNELAALALLDGRFRDIRLANNPNGQKRGNFSLVFRAYDVIESRYVALKFMEPLPFDGFRHACFQREQSLLSLLVGAARCLQLVSPIQEFEFQAGTAESPFLASARYFVTEWCESDIDSYFFRQNPSQAIVKLLLFNEVILAVQALHSREIFHRDLKVDNFRCRSAGSIDGVVAIDLGTAALDGSQPILNGYRSPVGNIYYSAPEAFCGLAGDRSVAYLTDHYALGCMLFELFAEDDFWTAYTALNTEYELRIGALTMALAPFSTSSELIKNWNIHAPRFLGGLAPLQLTRDGSTAPLAIVDCINELIRGLTTPNFMNRRITLDHVRRRLWSAIRCLQNEKLAAKRAEQVSAARHRRAENSRIRVLRAQVSAAMGRTNGDSNGHA